MADSNFIGRWFAGLTDAEKTAHDAASAAFQQKQTELNAARLALRNLEEGLRTKYSLSASTPIAAGDLQALRAAETATANAQQADADRALSSASDAEKAKHAAWVAAGKPMPKIGIDTSGIG